MKHEIKTYFATFGLFEIARTIPHAFVTMYLLSSGLSISQVTITQIFFMVAVTVFKIPSGIIADKFNKFHFRVGRLIAWY